MGVSGPSLLIESTDSMMLCSLVIRNVYNNIIIYGCSVCVERLISVLSHYYSRGNP